MQIRDFDAGNPNARIPLFRFRKQNHPSCVISRKPHMKSHTKRRREGRFEIQSLNLLTIQKKYAIIRMELAIANSQQLEIQCCCIICISVSES